MTEDAKTSRSISSVSDTSSALANAVVTGVKLLSGSSKQKDDTMKKADQSQKDAPGGQQKEKAEQQPSVAPTETPEFPSMYMHLPRFWSIGVDSGKTTKEPVSINLYKEDLKDSWMLIMSFPGTKAPCGGQFVKKVMFKASR